MSATKRSAFTLVEILVVIAIIAILASLIMGAVMMVRARIPETTTRNDLLQLSTALEKFASAHGGLYPPNRLRLCSNYATYPNPPTTTLDQQSIAFLSAMFPTLNSTNPANVTKANPTGTYWLGIAWDGTNTNLDVTLEGDQVLVFILGGIPNGAGKPPLGFSTNPTNPAQAGGDRKKDLDFESSRIVIFPGTATFRGTTFPSYLDGFAANLDATKKKPYVYFSSTALGKKENNYDPTAITLGTGNALVSPYVREVPANQPLPISAQTQAANARVKYWNSTRHQLISAGADGTFGPGGTTTSVAPVAWPAYSPPECKDDMTNFNTSKLGAPD